jgi:hypothetical protein
MREEHGFRMFDNLMRRRLDLRGRKVKGDWTKIAY